MDREEVDLEVVEVVEKKKIINNKLQSSNQAGKAN